jgi:hypothetical protein
MPSSAIEPDPERELAARRIGFVAGRTVRLADGALWTLPARDRARPDTDYDALLNAVVEAEDRVEALRAGHVLTIFLLDRNYVLTSDALASLLTFAPADPALAALQREVLAFAFTQVGVTAPQPEPLPESTRPRWLRWLGIP